MKIIRLIQIGDIHYPDHRGDQGSIDLKDTSVSNALVHAVSSSALQTSMKEVLLYCEDHKTTVGGILICGDLTSRGNTPAYSDCLGWLDDALGLTNAKRWQHDQLHAVPGNHDINRKDCDPSGADLFRKFQPLEAAWQALGIPILPVKALRQTDVSANGVAARVFSMNSCLGCQERRHLPSEIQKELHELLEEYVKRKGSDAAFALVGEQIDTPAFNDADITEVVRQINKLPPTVAPVVLAHHNVLPQAMPRIALYTEALNAGLVRSRLSSCDHPVIYCHGHIHDDPIEVLSQPDRRKGRLVSVSAPEFAKGFNVLEIHYADEGMAVGCSIVPYRLQRHQGIERGTPIRVPLREPHEIPHVAQEIVSDIASVVTGELQRFRDVLEKIRKRAKTQHQQATVSDALLEAEWLGLIEIQNRDMEPKYWQIRRTAP